MTVIYLDSSAIVKRYVLEPGSETVAEVYDKALSGEATLSFSAWNIGEVLGVLDKYCRRGWLDEQDYRKAKYQFIGETLRLLKLRLLRVVPVKIKLLTQTWILIEKHRIYVADALQVVSARYVGARELYTGDKRVHEAAISEGIKSTYLG